MNVLIPPGQCVTDPDLIRWSFLTLFLVVKMM